MHTKTVASSETGNSLPEFLSAEQLSVYTGIPAGTFRYWAHIGSGPASFKLGRRRVWRRTVIDTWIAEQEAAGHPSTAAR